MEFTSLIDILFSKELLILWKNRMNIEGYLYKFVEVTI